MAGLPRNGWLVSVGITGRLAAESAAALRRNTQPTRARAGDPPNIGCRSSEAARLPGGRAAGADAVARVAGETRDRTRAGRSRRRRALSLAAPACSGRLREGQSE